MKTQLKIFVVAIVVSVLLLLVSNMFVKTDDNIFYIQTNIRGDVRVLEGDGEIKFFDPSCDVVTWDKQITLVCDSIILRNKYGVLDTISYTFDIGFNDQVDKLLVLYRTYDNFIEHVNNIVKDNAYNLLLIDGKYTSNEEMRNHILQTIVDDLVKYDEYDRKYNIEPRKTIHLPIILFL